MSTRDLFPRFSQSPASSSYFAADEHVDNGSSDLERETDENRSPEGDAEMRIALRAAHAMAQGWASEKKKKKEKVGTKLHSCP